MNLEFLKVHDFSELISKYNVSWLTTAGLTLAMPKIDLFFPLLLQIAFVVISQIIAIGVDFFRLKYLHQKTKSTVTRSDDHIEVITQFEEKEKE